MCQGLRTPTLASEMKTCSTLTSADKQVTGIVILFLIHIKAANYLKVKDQVDEAPIWQYQGAKTHLPVRCDLLGQLDLSGTTTRHQALVLKNERVDSSLKLGYTLINVQCALTTLMWHQRCNAKKSI